MIIGRILKRLYHSIRYRISLKYYKSDSCRGRVIQAYLENEPIAKLQLGCGPNRLPGWLNADIIIEECKKGAIYLDVGEHFPLPDESIDYVYSEHMIEHLNYAQAVNMLRECHRVLKPNGVIRISTPDLRFLLDLYQNPEKPENKSFIKWSAEGGAGGEIRPVSPVYVINKFHTTWGHKIIYDYDTLASLLKQNGFDHICQCELSQSTHEALTDVERHHLVFSVVFYKLQTMILEANKI